MGLGRGWACIGRQFYAKTRPWPRGRFGPSGAEYRVGPSRALGLSGVGEKLACI